MVGSCGSSITPPVVGAAEAAARAGASAVSPPSMSKGCNYGSSRSSSSCAQEQPLQRLSAFLLLLPLVAFTLLLNAGCVGGSDGKAIEAVPLSQSLELGLAGTSEALRLAAERPLAAVGAPLDPAHKLSTTIAGPSDSGSRALGQADSISKALKKAKKKSKKKWNKLGHKKNHKAKANQQQVAQQFAMKASHG